VSVFHCHSTCSLCPCHSKVPESVLLAFPIRFQQQKYLHCIYLEMSYSPFTETGPPRQWDPIRKQNWNNRFQHFQANQMSSTKQWNLNLWFMQLCCRLNAKLKPIVLSHAYSFKKNYTCMLDSAYFMLSGQMEAIVFIILQIFFATHAVLKSGEYSQIFKGIYSQVTCLDQLCMSTNIWIIINDNLNNWRLVLIADRNLI